MTQKLKLAPLEPKYFERTIKLGNDVHGDDYLNDGILQAIHKKSIKDGHNCSFVMLDTAKELSEEKVVGFRLTYAPGNWSVDKWCSPDLWILPIEQLCYFKSSTVDSNYLRKGIAKKMLAASIVIAKQLGAKGGICHTWMQSPGNAAYEYFVRCGGTLLKIHPNRWLEDSYAGYKCVVCGADVYCHCDAGEMILRFGD